MDLPVRYIVGNNMTVDFLYDADGRKLWERVDGQSSYVVRDYDCNCMFENNSLRKVFFEGGYMEILASGEPVFKYFLKDHLGSVRVVVSQTGAIEQVNHYYPYGDRFADSRFGQPGEDNGMRYTGKELCTETGLYDFSARFLNTMFGRFTTLDPLAEKYPNISPYAYCNCNPVRYIDYDGRFYGDPIRNPEIRRNRASNLYGDGIRYNNGEYRNHQGFDYYAPIGTDVLSVEEGTVVHIGENHRDYGQSVTIEHTIDDGNKVYSFYAHLSEVNVNVNDVVSEGQIIAKSGDSGKINPNEIVDTKFISQYPELKEQNKVGILKINKDGTIEIRDYFW